MADCLYYFPTNPPSQAPRASDGGSNHQITGNLFHVPCHHLEQCPGPWKASPWQHGTPERTEPDKGTHFQNNLTDTWAEEHGIVWVYHMPYHVPVSRKME